MDKNRTTVDISMMSILRIIGVVVALWFLILLRDILAILFIVFVIVTAVSPLIERLMKKGVPRPIAIASIYLTLLGAVILIFSIIIPPIAHQFNQLADLLPKLLEKITPLYNTLKEGNFISASQENLKNLASQLTQFGTNIFGVTRGLISGFVAIITIMALSLYILLEDKKIKDFIKFIVPTPQRAPVIAILKKIGDKMGGWLRGQVILMFVVGIIYWLTMIVLGIPFALMLAVIGGLLEILPTIGPIFIGILVAIVAFTVAPWKAVAVLVLFFIIQQTENNFLVPKIMQKTIGVSPVFIILAILIGAKLLGILGAILAVPAMAGLAVVIEQWHTIFPLQKEVS